MKRWAIYNVHSGGLLYDDYYAPTRAEALAQFREDIGDEELEPGITVREVVEDEEGRLVHKNPRRKKKRNPPASGLTTFLLVASGLIAILYVGKKLSK